MLESFVYSVNSVLPIFLLVLLGMVFRRIGWLSDSFFDEANRFVYRVSLPVTLFCDILSAGGFEGANLRLILFVVCTVFFWIALLCLVIPVFVRGNDKRGAMIQGIYRSNIAIMGVPLIQNMFGDEGTRAIAAVMPVTIFLFNALAVIILSVFAPRDRQDPPKVIAKKILLGIAKNPLIIGILLALGFSLLPFTLPAFLTKTLSSFSGLTLPLALMGLGASFRKEQLRGRLPLAIAATLMRCIVLPLFSVLAAVFFGFRGAELGVVFVIFASCTAVASYVMAQNMKSDHILAGQIVLFTSLFSLFSIFGGVFLLKYFALI